MRKKVFSVLMVALVSALSFVSCSKDSEELGVDNGSGSVSVSFQFAKTSTASEGRAATQSTAKPLTSWKNVKQLMMLFVDATDQVKAARIIEVPDTETMDEYTVLLSNIPAGLFKAYLIANYNEANITRPNGGTLWNEGNVVGQDINTLTLSLVQNSEFVPTSLEAGTTGFQSPAEIFMDSKPVTIVADETSLPVSFRLTRAVSMFRVRIDQSQNGNDVVNFVDTTADIRIRKIATTFNPKNLADSDALTTNLIYDKGEDVFKDADPTTGYSSGTILDVANNMTLWSDLIIFPGGSSSEGAKKLDMVISALAPVGYIPFGSTTPLTTPKQVYWNGQVQAAISANNILEVNCILKQAGSTEVPEPGSYGNLDITISIAEWGNISSTEIEM